MKVLIVYGTGEGQTRKISRYMEEVLQENGHQVIIADASEEPPRPIGFDAILIGSSIHIHKYQSPVRHYIMNHVVVLNETPSAFFSVCMAIASDLEEEHKEAYQIADDFLKETEWNPTAVSHIAGALRYTKYDYLKKLIMRMIAKKQGGSTDTSHDYEYTDWNEVKKFVMNFVNSVQVEKLIS